VALIMTLFMFCCYFRSGGSSAIRQREKEKERKREGEGASQSQNQSQSNIIRNRRKCVYMCVCA